MRLRKFRVRAYRCIHDSGEITVGDLAAFVGRNESGKTTILQALTLLNRDEEVSELDLCDEMNEELKEEMRLAEGEFNLNQHEISIIKEKFPGLPEIKKIKLFRTNQNPRVQYEFEDIKLSEDDSKGLNSWENFSRQIFGFLDTIPNHRRIQIDAKFFELIIPIATFLTGTLSGIMLAGTGENAALAGSNASKAAAAPKPVAPPPAPVKKVEPVIDDGEIG